MSMTKANGHEPKAAFDVAQPVRPALTPDPSRTRHRPEPSPEKLWQLGSAGAPPAILPSRQALSPEIGFSRDQLRKLAKDVDPRHVHTRELEGRHLSYIEGWYAVAQANQVFGYAGWDRETVHFERVMEKTRTDGITCAYLARVRIRVRAGSTEIIREGTGWGSASGNSPTAVHERALKAAETDATKRALSTFGPRFGLRLYDKDYVNRLRPGFVLYTPDGRPLDDNLSPEGYCTGFRQLVELCRDRQEIDRLQRYNAKALAELRVQVPTLRNTQGTHFADLLLRLMQRRREDLTQGRPSPGEVGGSRERGGESQNRAQHDAGRTAPGPGEAFRRYTGQSRQRRQPYPFPARTDASDRQVPPSAKLEKPAGPTASAAVQASADNEANLPQTGATTNPSADGRADDGNGATAAPLAVGGPSTNASGSNATKAPSMPGGRPPVQTDVARVGSPKPIIEVLDPVPVPLSKIANGHRIDKSKLWLALERRLRDKNHLKRVAELPCIVCNRQPSHAHHLRFAQRRGMSQKVSDEYVVPLCALHHGDLHRSASEPDWWARQKIDPLPISAELWARSH